MPGRTRLTSGLTALATSVAMVALMVPLGTVSHAQARKEPTPVRQNPNIERPLTNENFDSAVVNLLQQLVAAYGPIATSNDRPNPYTRIEPFGEPPPGNNGEWAAVTGVEGGPDGTLYVFHRCQRELVRRTAGAAARQARSADRQPTRHVGRGADGVPARVPRRLRRQRLDDGLRRGRRARWPRRPKVQPRRRASDDDRALGRRGR